jgi:hypothetical protein
MDRSISQVLRDFLHERRLMAEVARRMGKKFSTLASELNPHCPKAKFGLDDLLPLCSVLRAMGYDKELEGILHDYFESLRQGDVEAPASDELLPLVSTLMEKTGTLANSAVRLLNSTDDNELRQVASLLRSSLLPTTLRLGSLIDGRLKEHPGVGDVAGEPQPEV